MRHSQAQVEEAEAEPKTERLSLAEARVIRRSIATKITDAMSRFTRLGDRIDVLQAAQKKIREKEVLPLFAELGTQKLEEIEGGGGWYIADRNGKKSFKQEVAMRFLVTEGVDPKLVKRAFAKATKIGKPWTEVSRGKARKKNEGEEEED